MFSRHLMLKQRWFFFTSVIRLLYHHVYSTWGFIIMLQLFQVAMEISLPPSPMSDIVEMDVYLRHPDMSCTSFLSMPTGLESSAHESSSFVRLDLILDG